jgi:hypothetical protein
MLVLPFAHEHPHAVTYPDITFQESGITKQFACTTCWWSHIVHADLSEVQEPLRPVFTHKTVLPRTDLPFLTSFQAVSRAPPA